MIKVTALSVLLAWMAVTFDLGSVSAATAPPSVAAESAFIMSVSTSENVFTYNPDKKIQPGNGAKLMTAMVLLDNMRSEKELDNRFRIPDDAVKEGMYFKAGEDLYIRDLIYILLMTGSDDAARALAIYSYSDEASFVEAMNAKVQQMGLKNTHYVNVTGAEEGGQYTTAADTAAIAVAAYRYPLLEQIIGTTSYTTKAINSTPAKDITSTDDLSTGANGQTKYKGMIGGLVSGSAPDTGATYIGFAEQDDMILAGVLHGVNKTSISSAFPTIMDYGFSKVTRNVIVKKGKEVGKIKIHGAAKTRAPVCTERKGFVYIPPEGSKSLVKTQVVIDDKLEAPVKAGTRAGEYRIYVADELKGTVPLVVNEDIKKGWLPSKIYISNLATVIICLVILALVIEIFRIRARKKRIKRLRAAKRKEEIRRLALKQMEEDRFRNRGGPYSF